MRVLNSAEIDYRLTPLHAKLHMYKMLQGVLVAFVSIDVIFQSAQLTHSRADSECNRF